MSFKYLKIWYIIVLSISVCYTGVTGCVCISSSRMKYRQVAICSCCNLISSTLHQPTLSRAHSTLHGGLHDDLGLFTNILHFTLVLVFAQQLNCSLNDANIFWNIYFKKLCLKNVDLKFYTKILPWKHTDNKCTSCFEPPCR